MALGRTILWLVLGLSLVACGKQSRRIELEGNSYFFPAQDISGIVDPADSGSHQFYIRLTPSGGYYWLVYAPWKERRANQQGPGVPTIVHINDVPRQMSVTDTPVGKLVCAKKPINDDSAVMREIFSCGFRIHDNGVAWSVIIPGDLAASAPAIKRRAELTLADYRNNHWIK